MDLSKIHDPSEKLKFIVDSSDFNFSRINNQAAKVARGEYLVFLNDDTEVINGEWLSAMLNVKKWVLWEEQRARHEIEELQNGGRKRPRSSRIRR